MTPLCQTPSPSIFIPFWRQFSGAFSRSFWCFADAFGERRLYLQIPQLFIQKRCWRFPCFSVAREMLPHIFAYFLVNLFNLFNGEGQCFFKEVSFGLGILYSFCTLITLFLLRRYLPSEGSFEAFIKYLRVLLFNFDLLIYRRNNLGIYNLLGCIKLILGSIELIPLFWVDLYWSVLLLCGLLYS